MSDIADLARGAVLLGTGGGGDPYVGELFVRAQLGRTGTIEILPIDELDDEAFVVVIAGIGSPPVLLEHLVSERTLMMLFRRAATMYGRRIDALISAEMGGANAIFPLAVATLAGIPVVDGDGVGRAIPHIEMTSFSIFGARATPAMVMDDLGNCVTLDLNSDRLTEEVVRSITMAMGSIAYGVLYPMSGRDVKRCAIRDTLSLALDIGRHIRRARQHSHDVVGSLLAFLNGEAGRVARLLFDGKIADVRHETRDGWHWGEVQLVGLDDLSSRFSIEVQNEYLVARREGKVVVTMPDLISVLDRDSGEPLTAEMLAYGQRVKVIGLAADRLLTRPESLAVLGPRQFGLDHDFTPMAGS